jgi:hypothetical protein
VHDAEVLAGLEACSSGLLAVGGLQRGVELREACLSQASASSSWLISAFGRAAARPLAGPSRVEAGGSEYRASHRPTARGGSSTAPRGLRALPGREVPIPARTASAPARGGAWPSAARQLDEVFSPQPVRMR